ncbi:MAG: 3'-5' exonuclease [Verrucomicrobiia bacterium]
MSTWLLPRSELTTEQLRAIELSHAHHQIIFGAPGSGKTQILLHRAALLRDRMGTDRTRFRIFVYTNVLKEYIRSALPLLNLPDDTVITYDDWCKHFYVAHINSRPPWDAQEKRPDFSAIRAAVSQKVASRSLPLPKYDFVLVDEAQDLESDIFDTLRLIARHITVCLDNKQQIYERGSSEDDISNKLGLRRRNLSLLDAYRCSPFIACLACQFIPDPQDRQHYLAQVRTSQTERQAPLLFAAASYEEEKKRLIEVLRERLLIDQRIAILFPLRRQVYGFAEALTEVGIEIEVPAQFKRKSRFPTHNFNSNRPKLITYAGAKGLTFDSVLLPRLVPDSFPRMTAERLQRLLFVAITRAAHWVYLSTISRQELPLLQTLQSLVAQRTLTIQTSTGHTAPSPTRPETPPQSESLDFL